MFIDKTYGNVKPDRVEQENRSCKQISTISGTVCAKNNRTESNKKPTILKSMATKGRWAILGTVPEIGGKR